MAMHRRVWAVEEDIDVGMNCRGVGVVAATLPPAVLVGTNPLTTRRFGSPPGRPTAAREGLADGRDVRKTACPPLDP
jgi:hypothetical protein